MFSLLRTSGIASARRAFSTSPISRHDFAKVSILGRLANTPEVVPLANGKEMVRYSVAVTATREKPAVFYKVVNFAADGPNRQYLMDIPKGCLIYVEGDIGVRLVDAEDGKKYQSFNIIQRTVTIIMRQREAVAPVEEEFSQEE